MKTRRFDFDYKPLQLQIGVAVVGSVASKQNFDSTTGEYEPDYTIAPLVLQPSVGIIDKDGILPSGAVNQSLANIKWYEIIDGNRTLIETTNLDYVITKTGAAAGRIMVKKNAQPMHPITLEFSAEYPDPRNGQIYAINQSFLVFCSNSVTVQRLSLDAADQTLYNPLTDDRYQTIHASLIIGQVECPVANRIFVWELLRDNGTWEEVGTDETLDYHISIAADGTSATIDRSLMGAECNIRCRAKYDPYGNPSSVALNDSSPSKSVAFIRRIQKYEYDIFDVPYNIPPETKMLYPRTKIWGAKGLILHPAETSPSDPNLPPEDLLPIWYLVKNVASGSPSITTQVGTGMKPTIVINNTFSPQYGAVMGLDVVDRGAIGAWTDSDGKVLTDGSGNVLLIH